MPLTQQSAVFSNPSGDGHTIQCVIGPLTFTFDISQAAELTSGRIEDVNLIIAQAAIFLQQAGVDPYNLAAAGPVVNSHQYWWHT